MTDNQNGNENDSKHRDPLQGENIFHRRTSLPALLPHLISIFLLVYFSLLWNLYAYATSSAYWVKLHLFLFHLQMTSSLSDQKGVTSPEKQFNSTLVNSFPNPPQHCPLYSPFACARLRPAWLRSWLSRAYSWKRSSSFLLKSTWVQLFQNNPLSSFHLKAITFLRKMALFIHVSFI